MLIVAPLPVGMECGDVAVEFDDLPQLGSVARSSQMIDRTAVSIWSLRCMSCRWRF